MKTGSKNVKKINEELKCIETLTNQFKRKRISLEQYTRQINESLSNMNNQRDYLIYLKNIGQF